MICAHIQLSEYGSENGGKSTEMTGVVDEPKKSTNEFAGVKRKEVPSDLQARESLLVQVYVARKVSS